MFRTTIKCFAIVAAVLAVSALGTPQADAHLFGCCHPVLSVCCDPCCCTPVCCAPVCCAPICCDPCCGWGHWGCGWRHHCGLGCGGAFACCPVIGCCDTCCGPALRGGCGCEGGAAPAAAPTPAPAVNQPTPAPALPGPAAPAATPPKPTTGITRPDAGTLTIWVPEGAKVYVNGQLTRSTGNFRQFVSYGLKPGYNYNYVVRAELVRDGSPIEETHTVILTAGSREGLAFNFDKAKAKAGMGLASTW